MEAKGISYSLIISAAISWQRGVVHSNLKHPVSVSIPVNRQVAIRGFMGISPCFSMS